MADYYDRDFRVEGLPEFSETHRFENCDLPGSKIVLKFTLEFYGCRFHQTEFFDCDFASLWFGNCDLSTIKGVTKRFLSRCRRLTGCILPAHVYADAPVVPDIDARMFQIISNDRQCFDMSAFHSSELRYGRRCFERLSHPVFANVTADNLCGTTHCRAGFAVLLAGEAGKALEGEVGPHVAGCLIYAASRPGKPLPDFFCDSSIALTDIRNSAKA